LPPFGGMAVFDSKQALYKNVKFIHDIILDREVDKILESTLTYPQYGQSEYLVRPTKFASISTNVKIFG
jgi:hypothetical protein